MKKIILTIALAATSMGFAQSLESKIPANAQAVISVNGKNLLELIPISDFDNNALGKEMIKDISRKNPDYKGLNDLGFDLTSKSFYFYQPTDSISYHNFIISINDRTALEQIMEAETNKKINTVGNVSSIIEQSTAMIWNDDTFLFTVGERSYSYFSENEDRFREQAEKEEQEFYVFKRNKTNNWITNYATNLFSFSGASILSNKNYLKSIDNKASASAWINNYGELMTGVMGGLSYYMGGINPNYNNLGFGTMNAHLYFEKDAARMTTNLEVNDKWKKAIRRMYKSKMSNSFFKYFNENEVLGYTSIALNTEAVLDEYPNLMAEMYGGMLPQYKEEIDVSTELFSLILDEKEVGKLITGNMLFILNDISEKEVAYTTYEYDEDYNETKVEKTKKEMSPEFTFMIGSENEELLFRIMKLGIKHKAVEENINYYKLNMPNKLPFDLFAVIKDEIVFITSSEKQLANIISPNPVSNVGNHKKTIRRNAAVMYLDSEKLLSKVPTEDLRKYEKNMLSFATNNLRNTSYKSGKIKGNNLVSELVVETADNRENSLKVMLDFFEFMMKF